MAKKKGGKNGKGKNGDSEQFNLFQARAAREEGIDRVSRKCDEWITLGITRIKNLPRGYEGIAEDIRRDLQLGKPPSSGAVGAMTRYAMSLGLLIRTGEMGQPKGVKSHGRATYIWRKVENDNPMPG